MEIPNLAPGEHSFLIVLGDGVHRPIDPLVADNPEHLGLPRVASVPYPCGAATVDPGAP